MQKHVIAFVGFMVDMYVYSRRTFDVMMRFLMRMIVLYTIWKRCNSIMNGMKYCVPVIPINGEYTQILSAVYNNRDVTTHLQFFAISYPMQTAELRAYLGDFGIKATAGQSLTLTLLTRGNRIIVTSFDIVANRNLTIMDDLSFGEMDIFEGRELNHTTVTVPNVAGSATTVAASTAASTAASINKATTDNATTNDASATVGVNATDTTNAASASA